MQTLRSAANPVASPGPKSGPAPVKAPLRAVRCASANPSKGQKNEPVSGEREAAGQGLRSFFFFPYPGGVSERAPALPPIPDRRKLRFRVEDRPLPRLYIRDTSCACKLRRFVSPSLY